MFNQRQSLGNLHYSSPHKRRRKIRPWQWVLELLAGVLLLGFLGLCSLFVWVQTEHSQRFIQQLVDQVIVDHLGDATALKFARTNLHLHWPTLDHLPEISLRLHHVSIVHTLGSAEVNGQIPQLDMIFSLEGFLRQQYTPVAIGFHDMVIPRNTQTPIAATALLGPLIWWLQPSADVFAETDDLGNRLDTFTHL